MLVGLARGSLACRVQVSLVAWVLRAPLRADLPSKPTRQDSRGEFSCVGRRDSLNLLIRESLECVTREPGRVTRS